MGHREIEQRVDEFTPVAGGDLICATRHKPYSAPERYIEGKPELWKSSKDLRGATYAHSFPLHIVLQFDESARNNRIIMRHC